MSSNVDAMVRAGVNAYRAGNKAEARTLLERAIEVDSYSETAWLWLSAVVDTPEEQQTCLENVLVINPENDRARQGLKSLGIDPDAVLNQADEPEHDDYAIPTSSASSEYKGPQTSADEYDNWVDGLNLGNDDSADEPTTSVSEDLFGDIDFSAGGGDSFDIDDSIFQDDDIAGYAEEFAADEVDYADGSDYLDDIGDGSYIDDALFDEDAFDDGDDMFADISTLENFTDAVGTGQGYDESQFADDPYAPPPPPPEKKPQPTTEQLFASIPGDIQVTRAPGIIEKVPSFHYAIIGVLVLANIGALVFIGMAFIG